MMIDNRREGERRVTKVEIALHISRALNFKILVVSSVLSIEFRCAIDSWVQIIII